jgi:hypothetical protein
LNAWAHPRAVMLGLAFVGAGIVQTTNPTRAPAQTTQPAAECKIELRGIRALRDGSDRIRIVGEIINRCPGEVGVQLKATVRDAKGLVVDDMEFWPASVRNIEPEVPFAFSMPWRVEMPWETFELKVVDRRRW